MMYGCRWCLLAWMLNAGPVRDLFQFFPQLMQGEGMIPDNVTYVDISNACVASELGKSAGQRPFNVFKNCGFVPTATVQPCSAGQTLSKDPVFFNQFKDKICVVCCLLWVF